MATESAGEGDDLRFRSDEPRIHPSADLKTTRLGRYCDIGQRVLLRDVQVGDFTYFERGSEATHTQIGKFCSIAAHVRINALEHPMDRLTTHKISYRPNEYFRFRGVDEEFREKRASRRVVIGHDVWIGHGVVILPGVQIGTGAVIGANAVVTKDIAPFAIHAGVPAQRLRLRFPEPVSRRILALAWWDWTKDMLFDAVEDMRRLEIEAFLDRWEERAHRADLPSATNR